VPRAEPKVSVIVPVYNPGDHIDDCIRSLLGQSMPAGDLELIFVDDGSTDGTPRRLDDLAAAHPHVRVEHIPNSGWPGRPRNVGIGMARGDYLYFVDNDDWLGEEAAARLHRTAVEDEADIVIGKVVGHGGRYVPRGLFKANVHGRAFDSPDLLALLTPHKLFRRAFLERHGIRFPEGRRRLEDHPFVVDAYFRAERISVLADYPCYHWALRDEDVNASAKPFEAEGYYDNVREVLDLVEERTEPGPFREALMQHWYRGKMLGRVGSARFLGRDAGYRRELLDAIRELTNERFDERFDARLPFHLRIRAQLVRADRLDALETLAAYEAPLSAKVTLRRAAGDGTHLLLAMHARLATHALQFREEGGRVSWVPPEELREPLAGVDLDVGDGFPDCSVHLWLLHMDSDLEYLLPVRTELALEPGLEPGVVRPVMKVVAHVTPTTAAGGAPLPAGRWEVHAGVTVAGFYGRRRVRRRKTGEPIELTSFPPAVIVAGTRPPARFTREKPTLGKRARVAVKRPRAAAAAALRGRLG
jgi:poly(ribitol-phosphate) beta-N-acetylglucosaminyltransferase